MFDESAFGGPKPKTSSEGKAVLAMAMFIVALLMSGVFITIAFGSHSKFIADEALRNHAAYAYAEVRSVTSVYPSRLPTDKIGFIFRIKSTNGAIVSAYGSDFVTGFNAMYIHIGQNIRIMYDADDPSIARIDYKDNLPSRERQGDPFIFWIGAAVAVSAVLSIYTLAILKRA
jgi:hypothetical protein